MDRRSPDHRRPVGAFAATAHPTADGHRTRYHNSLPSLGGGS